MKNSDLEVLQHLSSWLAQGYEVELVTLVRCLGSAPRPVGSLAAIREDGVITGSVSGGCIEKELTTHFRKQGQTGLVRHNVSPEQAIRYGLPCGGSLELVFENSIDSLQVDRLISALHQRNRICRVVELSSGRVTLDSEPGPDVQGFQFDGETVKKVFGPSWRLLIIGAGELSRYVAEMGLALDYDVLVCEPREHFSKIWAVDGAPVESRLPDEAVELFASDSQSAVLALTHDPNLDDLALMEALTSDAFYVGALGSAKNNENRRKRLVEAFNLTDRQVGRLHGPIGLDIGSVTPCEIAVSILAEVTAIRRLGAVCPYGRADR